MVVADVDSAGAQQVAQEVTSPDGPPALPVKVDVSDRDAVRRMVDVTLERFGRIDVLVNNAAVFSTLTFKPIEQIEVDEWDRVMAVNVRGVFLCCQAVVPAMRRQGKGKIINISSGTILHGSSHFLHYVTSKGAVFAMGRALARELGADGITVNTIAPGLVPHDAVRRMHNPELINRQRQTRAIPRDETPEDLEGTLVFLASDDSDFMTGQMLVVNGGAQFW